LKTATVVISVWLILSLCLVYAGYSPASADVPYYGILRGFEAPNVSIAGYDIAADESGIYIVGEFFKDAGYGPMVLFLNPDHTFRCQNVLQLIVDNTYIRRVPAAGYSVALNGTHVIVAGTYSESPANWLLARLFIAVFDKRDCKLTGIRELIDSSIQWVNLYNIIAGAGIKVLWDSNRQLIYLMLQTLQTTDLDDYLYLFRFDSSLNILDLKIYNMPGPEPFFISDMADDENFLYLVGVYQQNGGSPRIILMSAGKDNLSLSNARVINPMFPGYDVSVTRIELHTPYIILTEDQSTGRRDVNIAFSFRCTGSDCSEDGDEAIRLGIVRFGLGAIISSVSARLYRWTPTHWNVPGPAVYGRNNTWLTGFVKAGGILYMVGFIGPSIYDPPEDGFVYAVDDDTLNAQYMFRLVSLDGNATSGGGRVFSAVLGAGSFGDYAYITGTAGNYYLEFNPFNPANITGTAELINIAPPEQVKSELKELTNFKSQNFPDQIFDKDDSTAPAGFYGVLRLKPGIVTTYTTTETSTTTSTANTTVTSTTTFTATRTVTSTPTTTVTRFTTSTRTSVATVVRTEYVFSTVYTTRIVEGTVTRYETLTSITTIPYFTTQTGTTTIRVTATAATTPIVYVTVQTTLNRTLTVRQTTTKAVVAEGYLPWQLLILPLIPLLLLPLVVAINRKRLTVTILKGASAQIPDIHPDNILNPYFKPSVGRLRKNGKVTFHNKDHAFHQLELYSAKYPGWQMVFILKPGEKVSIKMKEPGRYFFRLTTNPNKVGILEVE